MRVVVLWFAGEAPRGPARLGSIEPIRQLAVPGALAPLAALLRDPDGAIARGAARALAGLETICLPNLTMLRYVRK